MTFCLREVLDCWTSPIFRPFFFYWMHLNCTVLLWHIDCVEQEGRLWRREGETKDSKAESWPPCMLVSSAFLHSTDSQSHMMHGDYWNLLPAVWVWYSFQRLTVAEERMTLALTHPHTIGIIFLGQEQDGVFFPSSSSLHMGKAPPIID